MSSLLGRTLGQYEIVDVLGRGGMATVYLGRQASIDRNVAVKVLPPHPALDEAFKQRFQLEAKTIGSLQNPNILPLYDYGTFEDVLYLVMQYVEGGTLEDLIEMGPMDIKQVESITRSVAVGLDYAHNRGVIHRDIKPGNILMQDGHPLIADFGMVKMAAAESNLTGTAIVGTPSYMAPEQGQGLEVDHRVDVYALACMTYEMLTGQQPYGGSSPMQMILAHINEPVPDLTELRPDLNKDVAAVVRRGLAKLPENRYQSCGDFAEALSRVLHSNDDSLAVVQQEIPVRQPDTSTRQLASQPSNSQSQDTVLNPQTTQIIVRDSVNPYVLMGGFGLIAIVIVVIAVVLLSPPGENNNDIAVTPDSGITTTVENTPEPTPVPVLVVEPEQTFGEVSFSTENAFGDRVEVRLTGVTPAQGDNVYAAWLLNTDSGDTLAIGRIIVDAVGNGTVTFTDPEGQMLAALYNSVIITLETEIGDTPAGEVAYSNAVPALVSSGLQEIFVASENGLNGGSLLAGAVAEANVASNHAGLAAGAATIGGLRSHSEHTINILNGEQEDYDGNGSGQNPGRGIGVFFFLDAIETIIIDATSMENASTDLQSNAEFIRVCTGNVRGWAEEVIALELEMIAGETVEAVFQQATESTTLAAQLISGLDLNENGFIEAFEGECGLDQIPDFGLQFARMQLLEGDVNAE